MLGASYGSGTDPGVAMLGSDALARWRADYLADDRSYDGMILTNIGPYALRQNVSFPWFEGSTLSSISSSVKGAMIHELAHAFGLPHDFRNDDNFHGDLMGNGLRGVRGCAFLGRYTNDYTDLTLGAARALNVSRYFGGSGAEDVKPNLTITTSGTVTPSNGHIRISYRASDASGLSGAHLKLNGDLIADMPLSGTNVSSSFSVPNLTPGSANALEISVWDIHGNRCNANTSVTPTTGANRAPIPKFRITQPVGVPGQMVTLDASGSSDPDHSSSSLTVEWDLDGDGVFETSPTSLKTISVPLSATGTRPVSVRVSDPLAARSTSASVALLTHRPALGISLTTVADSPLIEWFSKLGFLYYLERSFTLNMPDWRDRSPPGIIGDGGVQQFEDVLSAEDAAFYRLRVSLRDGN
jgi:hypothetical protein